MGRATPREIMQSLKDHAIKQGDQGEKAPQRHAKRGLVAHTSEGHPQEQRAAYNRRTADPRDRYWRTLGKQVRAGARITLKG